jgi:hypothetical protein
MLIDAWVLIGTSAALLIAGWAIGYIHGHVVGFSRGQEDGPAEDGQSEYRP